MPIITIQMGVPRLPEAQDGLNTYFIFYRGKPFTSETSQ